MKVLRARYSALQVEVLAEEDLRGTGAKWEMGGWYSLAVPFAHEAFLGNGKVVRTILDRGFIFNSRSGPAAVDMVLPKMGAAGPVWAAHDGHYNAGRQISRALADAILYGGLDLEGFAFWRRSLGWLFVRGFGWMGSRSALKGNRGKVRVEILDLEAWGKDPLVVDWDKDRRTKEWNSN